eukprot:gene1228-894_t
MSTGPTAAEEDPRAKKRFYVIQEILSTEHTYVTRLKLTIDVVLGQMRSQNILDKKDLALQFEGIEKIYELHARHSLDGTTSQNLKFLSLFEDIASNCDIYSQYLANYEPAMQRRGHLLTKNRRYSDFVANLEKDPVMQGANLEALLILPVQRIPRYRLLMEQLIKYTPEDHPDHATLQTSLATISLTAEYNNEAIRARENKEKILQIMLQIEPTTRVDLLEDVNRRFVMEATLLRQCRKRYKEFQFWLFNDQLCYGEKTPLGLYTLNRQISLDRCYIQELPADAANAAESFIVLSPAKTFQVKTRSAAERRDWTDAIQLHIAKTRELRQQQQQREQHEGGGGGVGELAAIAPLWKPDTNSPDCELCGTVFTLLYRRHHCRHCGVVVCDGCSSKRFKLPHVDSRRPVRVCDRCFTTLAGSGKRPSLSFTTAASSTSAVDTTASTSLSVSPAVLKGAVRLPFAPPPPPPVSSPSTFSPPPPPPRQPPSVAASASSGCDSPSTPPPKPMRAQRRTNIVLHIDPAVLALEAARKAPHAASQEDD